MDQLEQQVCLDVMVLKDALDPLAQLV